MKLKEMDLWAVEGEKEQDTKCRNQKSTKFQMLNERQVIQEMINQSRKWPINAHRTYSTEKSNVRKNRQAVIILMKESFAGIQDLWAMEVSVIKE